MNEITDFYRVSNSHREIYSATLTKKGKRREDHEDIAVDDERNFDDDERIIDDDEQNDQQTSMRQVNNPSDRLVENAEIEDVPDISASPNEEHITSQNKSDTEDDLQECYDASGTGTDIEHDDMDEITMDDPPSCALQQLPSSSAVPSHDVTSQSCQALNEESMEGMRQLVAYWDNKTKNAESMGTLPRNAAIHQTVVGDKSEIYIDAMNHIRGQTLSPNFDYLPVANITVNLDNLKEYWQLFLREHTSSYGTLSRAESKLLHSKAESLYTQAAAALTTRVTESTHRAESSSSSLDRNVSELRLQKADVAQFNGESMKWRVLKSFFEQEYHNGNVSDMMKMHMLRSYINDKSDALNVIAGIEPTGEALRECTVTTG